jgi:uncharacterized protein
MSSTASCPEPSLEQKLEFLALPSHYPEQPSGVEVIETHMSWVFLTGRYAYKLKKPVQYDFLDFRLLSARRFYCEEELRLNRRLAASVYLCIVPLTQLPTGELALAGEGNTVEWLVKMRRLPENLVLEQCLQRHSIPAGSLQMLADRLAKFYGQCQPAAVSAQQYRERLRNNIESTASDLCQMPERLPLGLIRQAANGLLALLQAQPGLFDARVQAGRIVEGHGDLRLGHVYLEDEPVIVDCLEFSIELRTLDAADDVAFLSLECERLGAPKEGELIFALYSAAASDCVPPQLLHFYQAYRACLRARIALWHLKEAQFRNSPKWKLQAQHYLELACRHSMQCR